MSDFLFIITLIAFSSGLICTGRWLLALFKKNQKKTRVIKIGTCCAIISVAITAGILLDLSEGHLSTEKKASRIEHEDKTDDTDMFKGKSDDSNEKNDFSSERKDFANLKELMENKSVNIEIVKGTTFAASFFKQTLQNTDYYYYGELKDGRPHGKGIKYNQISSSIYIGNFSNGKMNGYGTEYLVNISINKNNGDFGIYKAYEGYFKDNEYSGKGNKYTLVYNKDRKINIKEIIEKVDLQSVCINNDFFIADKKFYDLTEFLPTWKTVGSFANNHEHGKIKKYKIDKLIYDGDVKYGQYHGKGTIYHENGTIKYEGQWEEGQPHGEGISYYDNGNIQYEGGIKNGKYHGKGVLYNPDGSLKYKGNFGK